MSERLKNQKFQEGLVILLLGIVASMGIIPAAAKRG
jgi:hypothetical protein